MKPPSAESETTEDLASRVVRFAFGTLVVGSGVTLASGVVPPWVEQTAAGFLWFVVVFFLALMAALSWWMHARPLPHRLRHLREEGRPMRMPGGWIGSITRKFVIFLIVVLLVAAGRLVLAGLFVGLLPAGIAFAVSNNRWVYGFTRSQVEPLDWAVYRVFRAAFLAVRWCLWVVPVCAAQVRLFQTGARFDGRLIDSLGLPRPFAYLLYGPRLRVLWLDLLPTVFWLLCAALALGLAFAPLPPAAAPLATGLLWAGGGLVAAVSIVAGLIARPSDSPGGLRPYRRRRSVPTEAARHLRNALRIAALAALLAAGLFSLAACYLAAMVATMAAMGIGLPRTKDDGA